MVGLIRVHVGSLRRNKRSSGSFAFAWARSGAPRGHLVYSGFRMLSRVRLGVVRFHVGSLARVWCRLVHPGSRGFTRTRLLILGFIRVIMGLLWWLQGSFLFARWFTRA